MNAKGVYDASLSSFFRNVDIRDGPSGVARGRMTLDSKIRHKNTIQLKTHKHALSTKKSLKYGQRLRVSIEHIRRLRC